MASIFLELNDDPDTRHMFFSTLFDKMHLQLSNIKIETFHQAEKNLEILRSTLDFDGAALIFVNSSNFFNNTMNG